jgi:hypothetical protein
MHSTIILESVEIMTLKELIKSNWSARTILIIWLASSVLILLSLKSMESSLIYGQFSDYGLRWSPYWAIPYSAYMYSIYFFLAVPMAMSVILLVLSFLNMPTRKKDRQHVPVKEQKSKANNPEPSRNDMLFSCPSCKKVFGRPLLLLDSSSGSSRIINVCPYCNSRLNGEAENKKKNIDIGIISPNQQDKTTSQGEKPLA